MSSLTKRLDAHFVACAAAAGAAVIGTTQQAEAAIVYRSTPVVIPGTFAGVYLNVFTGASGANTTVGWDLNPYDGGNRLFQTGAAWHVTGGFATNLAPGAIIDGTGTYAVGNGATTMTQNFTAGVPAFIGFRFTEGVNTYYGWARLNKGANATTAGAFVDHAFNDTPNGGIMAGQIPAPGSLALLALGALGLAGRRRK